jgi:gluconolactonase
VAADFLQPKARILARRIIAYIVDTDLTHNVDGPAHVRRFRVSSDCSSITVGEVFATCPAGPVRQLLAA